MRTQRKVQHELFSVFREKEIFLHMVPSLDDVSPLQRNRKGGLSMNNYRGHPLQAAIDVCPTEEEANLVAAAPAMKKAIEGLLDARFTGGYCPWCGIRDRSQTALW